jgi:hypothetical protein
MYVPIPASEVSGDYNQSDGRDLRSVAPHGFGGFFTSGGVPAVVGPGGVLNSNLVLPAMNWTAYCLLLMQLVIDNTANAGADVAYEVILPSGPTFATNWRIGTEGSLNTIGGVAFPKVRAGTREDIMVKGSYILGNDTFGGPELPAGVTLPTPDAIGINAVTFKNHDVALSLLVQFNLDVICVPIVSGKVQHPATFTWA